jgi:ribonuclease HII
LARVGLVVGVDEAGYGPRLGPLVVAAVGFEGGDASSRAIAEAGRAARVPVGDSKEIYRRPEHFGRLERTAGVLIHLAGGGHSVAEVLRVFGGAGVPQLPWYAGGIPLEFPPDCARAAAQFHDALGGPAVRLRVALVDAPDFNDRLRAEGNKAALLFGAFAETLAGMLDSTASHAVRVIADAQGARRSYLPLLRARLPRWDWRAQHEGRRSCQYVGEGLRRVHVRFDVKADARWALVGLASCVAKYLRESVMRAFRAYWKTDATGYPNARTAAFLEEVARRGDLSEPAFVRLR